MKNSVLAALTLALFSGSAAFAADPYSRGSTKDAPAAVVGGMDKVNWTGFYIGGRLGYGHANHDLTVEEYVKGQEEIVCPTETSTKCEDQPFIEGKVLESFGLNGLDSSGATGGGQLGFDLQRGRFVFGIFGSYDVSGAETTISASGTEVSLIEKGDEWSAGVRAGLLVNPRTMAYVLAAYTESDFNFAGVDEDSLSNREITFSGLTVGGGVEFALTQNVFLGVEGTHTFYGKETITDSCDFGEGCGGGDSGTRLTDEIGETKVMGTLKIKLNTDLGVNLD